MYPSLAETVSGVRTDGFRLSLLGRFNLRQDGREVRLRTRKEESLLAYLVLHPDKHTREGLAELFWGDTPELQARASLRAALANLRGAVGPDTLLSDRVVVQFSPEAALWVDAREFRAQVTAFLGQELADPAGFDPCLYTGELLAGHYDEWVLDERERLRQLHLDALLHRTARLRALGRCDEAIVAAHHVLEVDPAEERAHRHLIFLYSATGNRPAALRQFELCRRSLKEELDVEPSAETLALVAAIAHDDGHATGPAELSNLPTPLTSFVGREREMAAVSEVLLYGRSANGGSRLVTLTGPGGSGKTRLAIQVARLLAPQYPHGAWWVDLSSLTDPALLPDTALRAFGVAPAPGQLPMQTLIGFLRGRTLLLALDNCEQLTEACAHPVASILEGCPHVQVLATSRGPLGVPGEQLWQIPTFAVPAPGERLDTEALLRYDGVRLFVERARMQRLTFSLQPHNAAQVSEICRRLDGIPLAIELAAARVRTMELDDILARLQNRLRLLASGSTLAPPRQQTLRASIDWSYNLLSPAECLLLQRLAVFLGGCTLAAAEAVCAGGDLAEESILDLLARLVDRSLVISEGGRYRLLETIREYALERLVDEGEAAALRQRHAAYFAAYLGKRYEAILSSEQDQAIVDITTEIGNERAAWDWAVTMARYDLVGRAASSLGWYYELRNGYYEGEVMYGRAVEALAAAPAGARADEDVLARLHAYHGYFQDRLGRLLEGYQELERGCAGLRQAGLPAELALALTFLGGNVWRQGQYARARAILEESLGIARSASAHMAAALSLFFLGLVEHSMGDAAGAEVHFREALTVARGLRQPRIISMTLVLSAQTLLALRQYDEARERLKEGLTLARRTQDRWLMGTALGNLGWVLLAQGDLSGAGKVLLEAVALARETGSGWEQMWGEVALGDVYLAQRDAGQAETHYRSGLQRALAANATPLVLEALAGLAELRALAGDQEEALELAGQVARHPASSDAARTRANKVVRLLGQDLNSLPAATTVETPEGAAQRILLGSEWRLPQS